MINQFSRRTMGQEQMTSDEQIERNKLAASRGWLADPPPAISDVIARYIRRTPEERSALIAAGNRRYAHLRDQPRDWIADPRRNRRDRGATHNRGEGKYE